MKVCRKCSSTDFYTNGKCRTCARARSNAWRVANPDRAKARTAAWVAQNRDKKKCSDARWGAANKGRKRASNSAYRNANVDELRSYHAEWRARNPSKVRTWNANWKAENPVALRIHQHNRRAAARGGKLSKDIAERLYRLQRGMCPCCKLPLGNDYHLDHRLPLALGGANEDWNMQLLRAVCNMQKNAKHPVDFMQSRGFLL